MYKLIFLLLLGILGCETGLKAPEKALSRISLAVIVPVGPMGGWIMIDFSVWEADHLRAEILSQKLLSDREYEIGSFYSNTKLRFYLRAVKGEFHYQVLSDGEVLRAGFVAPPEEEITFVLYVP